jgi:hypothetical protein
MYFVATLIPYLEFNGSERSGKPGIKKCDNEVPYQITVVQEEVPESRYQQKGRRDRG